MTCPGIHQVGLVMVEVFLVTTVMMTMAVMMATGDCGGVVDGGSVCW